MRLYDALWNIAVGMKYLPQREVCLVQGICELHIYYRQTKYIVWVGI